MRHSTFVLLLAGALLLQGCDWMFDDKNGGPERITATEASISQFSVTGTSFTLLPTSPKPINPAENGGAFTVQWAVSSDGIIDIELSVKEAGDNTAGFCADGSYEFHDLPCGGDYVCQQEMTLDCTFDNDNRLQCTNGKGTNLTKFLDTVPKEADIQMKVRALDGTDCASERVVFE